MLKLSNSAKSTTPPSRWARSWIWISVSDTQAGDAVVRWLVQVMPSADVSKNRLPPASRILTQAWLVEL